MTLEQNEPYGTRTALRVRAGQALNTAFVADIPSGKMVRVAEIQGVRARIVSPVHGWIFTKNDKNEDLIVKIQSNQIRARSLSQAQESNSQSSQSVGQRSVARRSGSTASRSSSVNSNLTPDKRRRTGTPLRSQPQNVQNTRPAKRGEPTVVVDFVAMTLSEKQLKQRLALRGIHAQEVRFLRRAQSYYAAELTFKTRFAAQTAVLTNHRDVLYCCVI